mmetsp:Transcript_93788/g.190980  ORF Transcript_93788/g.190980 Transcript_93788/m.190980 type:complete len:112 (-) Transcript_93788:55-390(-)
MTCKCSIRSRDESKPKHGAAATTPDASSATSKRTSGSAWRTQSAIVEAPNPMIKTLVGRGRGTHCASGAETRSVLGTRTRLTRLRQPNAMHSVDIVCGSGAKSMLASIVRT